MNEEKQPILLICAPIAWGSDQVIPGSLPYDCQECGQPIWVAPTGQRMIENQNAKAVCVPCGQVKMEEEENVSSDRPTDDQMQELRDAILRERL